LGLASLSHSCSVGYRVSMGDPVETELEMVECHVLRGEFIIEQQRLLIQRLRNAGKSTVEAGIFLEIFQNIQAVQLVHLARVTK
jgi:hypothetical protein